MRQRILVSRWMKEDMWVNQSSDGARATSFMVAFNVAGKRLLGEAAEQQAMTNLGLCFSS